MKDGWTWMSKYRYYTHVTETKSLRYGMVEIFFNMRPKCFAMRISERLSVEEYIIQCFIYRKRVLENYPTDPVKKQEWDRLLVSADANLDRILDALQGHYDTLTHRYIASWFRKMLVKISGDEKLFWKIKNKIHGEEIGKSIWT